LTYKIWRILNIGKVTNLNYKFVLILKFREKFK
jgi:hypothetical protein